MNTAWLWSIYAKTYDGLMSFRPYRELVQEIVDRADVKPGQNVIELGCGTGNILASIAKSSDVTLVGVDSSSAMLSVARTKLAGNPMVSLHEKDIFEFLGESATDSIDCLIINNVAYTVKDQERLWREIVRVLTPTGHAVVSNPITTSLTPLIKAQLAEKSVKSIFQFRLIPVLIINVVISLLGEKGDYPFHTESELLENVQNAGGKPTQIGKSFADTNSIFTFAK